MLETSIMIAEMAFLHAGTKNQKTAVRGMLPGYQLIQKAYQAFFAGRPIDGLN
jgi:hypothetical protein